MPKAKPLKATNKAKGTEIAVYSTGDDSPEYKLVEFDQFKNEAFIDLGGKK